MIRYKVIFLILFFVLSGLGLSIAQLRFGSVFTDNMIIQREKPIKVWGYANPGESLNIDFQGKNIKAKADKKGNWSVVFPASAHGGPFSLTANSKKEHISIENIMIGELWFASGQSNMEMPIAGWGCVNNFEKEISDANYHQIRMFTVEKSLAVQPQSEFKGQWLVCSPATAPDFSATAYFFARKLYQELNVPIGIIHSSWGGTEIESWISSEAYEKLPSKFWNKYQSIPTSDLSSFLDKNKEGELRFTEAMDNDKGLVEKWYGYEMNTSDWKSFTNPREWQGTELVGTDGSVWFRYEFDLPSIDTAAKTVISLGAIDDNDETWVNGTKIGETRGYNVERIYNIPQSVLNKGRNVIAVRVINESGEAGFTSHADKMFIQTGDKKYSLAGEWKYKISANAKDFNFVRFTPYSLPSLLYNAMVNPVKNLPIRGVIWYQGESNENNAEDYKTLFPTLIKDWRAKWNDSQMPFYWVQLANYKDKDTKPSISSKWAVVREAQDMALQLPNTGQAITTDIGDAKDIHPKNKQDVGLRLALIALKKTYGKNVISSGPRFQSYAKSKDQIIITLSNIADGLMVANKYGYIEGFDVAGSSGQFQWIRAKLDGNRIIIDLNQIQYPATIRYSWCDNPDVNIFNSEGLPLAPFKIEIK